MALQNLKAEMRRKGITQAQVAKSLGMSENNFCLKCNERIPMTVDEAKAIRERFMPEFRLDYLLASDGDVASERDQKRNAADSAIEECVAQIRAL